MSQNTTEKALKSIQGFLGELARNQKLAKSTDPELRDICTQASRFEHDMSDAIANVHRNWKGK